MKRNGKIALRVAGILEILIGVGAITMTLWILKEGNTDQAVLGLNVAKEALLTLIFIYAIAGFRIISGIIGLVCADKPKSSTLCIFLGLTLMIISVAGLNHTDYSLDALIIDYISLFVPALFLYGAIKNKFVQLNETGNKKK